MRVRKAQGRDATAIHRLVSLYSPDGTLLPRSLEDIRAHICQFVIAEVNSHVVGCGALHSYPNGLVELRSIAVVPNCQRSGVGTRLVRRLLREARRQSSTRIFLFTRIPDFFARLGFTPVPPVSLPEKIWKDCRVCPRLFRCDEIPMVYGAAAAAHMTPDRPEPIFLRVLPG